MNPVDLESIAYSPGGTARFIGAEHGSPISAFVARNQPGTGPDKHRHPYAETFFVLEGEIEFIIDGETQLVGPGAIAIAPAMAWHEFKNRSDHRCLMVNVHPVAEMSQEDWTPESDDTFRPNA